MLFGITGASGTGKSTLARAVSEEVGIEFIPTSVTEMARECGYDAVGQLDLPERLDLQEKMLVKFRDRLRSIKNDAILDRTPIDMIGYMLAEMHMHSDKGLTDQELERVTLFSRRCKIVTATLFDHVFVTSILPEYVEAETRPPLNRAYQLHTHLLMMGAVIDAPPSISHSIILTTDLDARRGYVSSFVTDRIAEVSEKKKTCRFIH